MLAIGGKGREVSACKVGKLDLHFGGEHNVAWMQTPMDEVTLVQVGERPPDLTEQLEMRRMP